MSRDKPQYTMNEVSGERPIEVELTYPAPRPVMDLSPLTLRQVFATALAIGTWALLTFLLPEGIRTGSTDFYPSAFPPQYREPAAQILCAAMSLFFVYLLFALYKDLSEHRRLKHLVQQGMPVIGKVISKEILTDRCKIRYEYMTPKAGESSTATQKLSAIWLGVNSSLEPGDEVTILYEPSRPSNSTIYSHCGYRAYISAG